ncbi:MAG: glycosyltransferase family 39 protein [Anaerolineae bacterium]|nr:glycosyltransferase family 39 protein [Candidatus Roseilinea sp.]MDW8448520.1 glycosyltransferase family 39 protein [Anaerolineae bacterium]
MLARLRSIPLRSHWLFLGTILLLAAVLRFYKIGAQSLWYDEGNSARIAERSLALIVEGAAGDIHPPLYYIALKYWRAAFGESEATLRAFSATCGVLTVLCAYLIGRDAFGRRVGLIAAFLLAVMPFAIYYAQEARMYALLALCAAASTWAVMRMGRLGIGDWRSENRDWRLPISNLQSLIIILLYIAATTAGLWTHYAYPFVMIAQGVAYLALTLLNSPSTIHDSRSAHERRNALILYTLANVVAITLFLPWLPVAIRQVQGWGVDRPAYALGPALLDAYRTLIVGRTLPPDQATLPVGLFTAFVALGAALGKRETLANRLAMLALAGLPLALLFAFGLYREAYLKFLLVCVLPLCVLAARGVVEIGDWRLGIANPQSPISNLSISNLLSTAITLTLAATLIPSLRNLYDDPAYARDDYRGIQRMIAADARSDDAVLFLAPNQWEVFTYYQRDDRNLFPLTYRPASYEAVAAEMQAIASAHRRIFALYFAERDADPEGWYELWMSGNLYKVHERWVGNIRLAIYDSGTDRDAWPVAAGATFGDAIALVEARGRLGKARRGDTVPVELTWQATAKLDRRYKVFIHIGLPDGAPVAQHDSEPVAGYRPTDGWAPGERIVDRRGAWIGPDVSPGVYGVFVGLYEPDTGARLPVTQNGAYLGDRLKIGEITIR